MVGRGRELERGASSATVMVRRGEMLVPIRLWWITRLGVMRVRAGLIWGRRRRRGGDGLGRLEMIKASLVLWSSLLKLRS